MFSDTATNHFFDNGNANPDLLAMPEFSSAAAATETNTETNAERLLSLFGQRAQMVSAQFRGPFVAKTAMQLAPPPDDANEAPLPKRRAGWTHKELSPLAKELVGIRHQLAMTQTEYALALGMPRDRLVNLENGRTKSVSKDLINTARKLLQTEQRSRLEPLEMFRYLPMSQIVDRWWSKMDIESDAQGAEVLGLTPYTIERWRQMLARPSDSDLLRYERLVNWICERERERLASAASA